MLEVWKEAMKFKLIVNTPKLKLASVIINGKAYWLKNGKLMGPLQTIERLTK